MTDLTIRFPDENLARQFAEWMCDGNGEQSFDEYCRDRGPGIRLQYRTENEAFARNDSRRYGRFMADRTITVHVVEGEL